MLVHFPNSHAQKATNFGGFKSTTVAVNTCCWYFHASRGTGYTTGTTVGNNSFYAHDVTPVQVLLALQLGVNKWQLRSRQC